MTVFLCVGLSRPILAAEEDADAAKPQAAAPAPISSNPNIGSQTGLSLPRFVSLRTAEVNARTGPGTRYPIDWVYTRKNLPVQITEEFSTWRKIRDVDGAEGWIHQTMVVGKDTALVIHDNALFYDGYGAKARPIARLQKGVIAEITRCQEGRCHLQIPETKGGDQQRGWANKEDLWGAVR
jgi:SH3-like domain-containing protein